MTAEKKHILLQVANVFLCVAAYAYLTYLLLTYPDYEGLIYRISNASLGMWVCLLAAFLLMPLNLLLEALKWRYLLRTFYPLSISQAYYQVLHGLQGAFLTPARLGEYPTRVLSISDHALWPKAIAQGFVGSAALSAVNIICGLIALALFSFHSLLAPWMISCAILFAILLLVLVGIFQKQGSIMVVFLSLLRYIVFSIQFALMLYALSIQISTSFITLIPVYYMLVTILPAIPVADPAIKGSISAIVFSAITSDTAIIALATMLLWVINTVIPMLCSTFLKKSLHNS